MKYECDLYEVMWISLRPKQLPRPLSILLIGVVHCPPNYNATQKKDFSKILMDSRNKLLRKYPDAGILLTGDFNNLATDFFNCHLRLYQFVKQPTRKANILDKNFY
jgi:hypothetical protein